MKVRIIYDKVDQCFYAQYRKWWYLNGWQTFQDQIDNAYGKSTKLQKFSSVEEADTFLNQLAESKKRKEAFDKKKKEKNKSREVICIVKKMDIDAPEYFNYST